jgi:hypothetical protein
MQYRRISSHVKAWQFGDLAELPAWIDKRIVKQKRGSESLLIETPDGVMEARPGDWLVLDHDGNLFPIEETYFLARFEAVPALGAH